MTRSTVSPTILICAGVSVLASLGLVVLALRWLKRDGLQA